MEQDGRQVLAPSFNPQLQPVPGAETSPMRNARVMPRPQIVKRDTSHQNENVETKHCVKRAALNRDNSLASNRLKAEYMPEYYEGKYNSEQEVKRLGDNLEQSTLASGKKRSARPEALKETSRVSTFDMITTALMAKPEPLLHGNRVSTIDALGLDLDVDPIIDQQEVRFDNPVEQMLNDTNGILPKPKAITADNRLTTMEFLEIVNAPMGDDGAEDDQPPPLNQEKLSENWLTQA